MEKIIENTIYTCAFCGKNYDNKETAETHVESCWFNYCDRKQCFTCKHMVEVKQAPFPGNENQFAKGQNNWDIISMIGPYDEIGCALDIKEGYLPKNWLLEEHVDCWEQFDKEEDAPLREETPEFVEYMKLIEQAIEEEEREFEEIQKQELEVVGDYNEEKVQ